MKRLVLLVAVFTLITIACNAQVGGVPQRLAGTWFAEQSRRDWRTGEITERATMTFTINSNGTFSAEFSHEEGGDVETERSVGVIGISENRLALFFENSLRPDIHEFILSIDGNSLALSDVELLRGEGWVIFRRR